MTKIKLGEVPESFIQYLNDVNPRDLEKMSIVLSNGIWDVYLDYTGTNYENAVGYIRNLANYKKNLIMELVVSEGVNEILNASRNLSDYLDTVSGEFTVSISSRKNYFLNLMLRARVFFQNFF